MHRLFILFVALAAALSISPAHADSASLLAQAKANDASRYAYDISKGAAFTFTSDNRSYYGWWQPGGWTPANGVIVALHGHGAYATSELYLWQPYAEAHGHAVLTLQWWLGGGEDTSDYYTPSEIYPLLSGVLSAKGVGSGQALFAGFSRGSANSYAVAAMDNASSGHRYFGLVLSNAGGAMLDYPPNQEITKGSYGSMPFNGMKWAMYCGERDPNPDRDGCNAMSATKNWVMQYGATVVVYIDDPSGDHGGFMTNSSNVSQVLNQYATILATPRPTLKDAVYVYGKAVNGKGDKLLVGVDCDVFQLLLDVTAGYSNLSMGSANTLVDALAGQSAYPDTIQAGAAMFAYALYGTGAVKSFSFNDKSQPTATASQGTVTAFGYCYGTRSTARVYLQEKDGCTNTYGDKHTASCATADNGSGTALGGSSLVLRDAIYLYDQKLNAKGDKILAGENCDVFQLVLSVGSGYTDLAMGMGTTVDTAVGAQSAYPDRIQGSAGMFSYAQYDTPTVKTFSFNDKSNSSSSAQTGTVTAFGYCYSTQAAARVYLREKDLCTDRYSNGSTAAIAGCVK